jgi:hypothetical protein
MVLAAVLGEWLCLQRELQEIPIGAAPQLWGQHRDRCGAG